jgi:hypothetical protein
MSQVFYSPIIKEAVDSVSQIMGLPRSHILWYNKPTLLLILVYSTA